MKVYYPISLHMHSVWERTASMEGHFYNAQKLGIHHVYITDHDIRMGRRKNHVDHFDFTKGVLKVEEPSKDPLRPLWYGFDIVRQDEGTTVVMKDGAMFLEAISQPSQEEWSAISLVFDSSQKRHEVALLAKTLLHLGMKLSERKQDMRIIVDVKLSQRPPEFKNAHIYYVFGNAEGLETPYVSVKSMDWFDSSYHDYDFDLLTDAESVGGGDNILNTISFTVCARNGQTARLAVNHLSITWELEFEEGRKMQQKLADEIGEKYEVTSYITSEITGAGRHKICFSTKVPIIHYKEQGYKVSEEYAIEHVRKYGGIFSRNHPFDHIKDKVTLGESPEVIAEAKQGVIREYIDHRAWGATMIEVGFPELKSGFLLADYLHLWDTLSSEGIFISGYGDSDSHANSLGWFEGNNFVAYIAAENPCEDEFINSMKAGDLYTGDPVYLQGTEASFVSSEGQMMGQVCVSNDPGKAIFELKGLSEDYKVVWTANGQFVKEETCNTDYQGFLDFPDEGKVNFIRVEVYIGERCILLTNPLYHTIDEDIMKYIPAERMYCPV